jgi:hypothetical protein
MGFAGQRAVYELATGNNAVIGRSWDNKADTSSSITECCHKGSKYRAANFSPRDLVKRKARVDARNQPIDEGDDDVYDDGEDEDPYEDCREDEIRPRKWPKQAYRAENYWAMSLILANVSRFVSPESVLRLSLSLRLCSC